MNNCRDLSDITVLIFSHERQHCLEKTLKYWNQICVKTIVLDNSKNRLKGADQLPYIDYRHIKADFSKRCEIGSELIESAFSIVVSDDELYTPTGLFEMKKALEADNELVSVGGIALATWRYGPITAGAWPYKGTLNYENSHNTSVDRIRYHTGDGKNPHSSFFTSNLNRSEHLQRCLRLYSKSPIVATEAISILAICSAGKSKYLNELYWIRNWNEFPMSHTNWDRSIYIHDWWRQNKGSSQWKRFRNDLKADFADSKEFDECWKMILSASEKSQPTVTPNKYQTRGYQDSVMARYLKFVLKVALNRNALPASYERVIEAMKIEGIKFDDSEVEAAVRIVKDLHPYKNWN